MEGRIFRESLAALLAAQSDFRVIGVCNDPAETVALCASHQPGMLVLGVLLAGPRDQSIMGAVRIVAKATRILALAPHGRDRCLSLNPPEFARPTGSPHPAPLRPSCLPRSAAGGAHGILDGDVDPATLFAAIRAIARGERWGVDEIETEPRPGRPLSPQELRVARLIGQGASNKEIAAVLTISDLTVKKHVSSIFHKLELQDRLQLGLRVARNPMAFESDGPLA